MVDSDGLQPVVLQAGAETEAMALSVEAGWNQVADDWRHFIDHGTTFGFRDGSARLVATGAALPYDGGFGFIGMVIVTASHRKRGMATRLLLRCMHVLESRKLVPVLDATELGEPVYRRQGFVPQFRYDRWECEGTAERPRDGERAVDVGNLIRPDARAFGARRNHLLPDLISRPDTCIFCDDGDGFVLVRRGRRAWQAGPVVASNEDAALSLLQRALAAPIPVFIDVPRRWKRIAGWLRKRGFRIQRSFARMALDRAEAFGEPDELFAIAGPEFG